MQGHRLPLGGLTPVLTGLGMERRHCGEQLLAGQAGHRESLLSVFCLFVCILVTEADVTGVRSV